MEHFEEEQLSEEQRYYFEEAPANKAIWHMVLPMLLSMIATLLYNMIDGYFIGKLNVTAMLAAVTLSLPISVFQMALGNFFGTGGGTYISRLLGEGQIKQAKSVSALSFWSAMTSGAVFALVAMLAMDPLLHLVGASASVYGYTKIYLSVFVLFSPVVVTAFALEEIVRAEGASKTAMIGMVTGVTLNIICAPLFIFGFKLGLTGAALATVTGNVAMVGIYAYHLNSKASSLSIQLTAIEDVLIRLSHIAKTGVSAFLMNLFLVVTCLVFNQYAAHYGESFIAGFGIAQRCVQLADFIGMSFAMGSVPLIAYAFAQGNFSRMAHLIKLALFNLIGLTALIALTLLAFRTQAIGLFTLDADVIRIGEAILVAQLASTLFAGLSALLTGVFQAVGEGLPSTVMALARGVIFLPVIVLGSLYFGQTGVIWSMMTSEGLATLIGLGLLAYLAQKGTFQSADLF